MDKQHQDRDREPERDQKASQALRPEPMPDVRSDTQSQGVQGMVTGALTTTEKVSSGMVGGVTNVATDVVHGIGTVGTEVVSVVRDTANTAIAGVGSIGETAVHTVTGLLADLVGGLRDVGSAAIYGRGTTTGGTSGRETTMRETETRPPQQVAH